MWADPLAVKFFDEDHSDDEPRYIRVGRSTRPQLLLVVFCEWEEDDIIRLISARPATPYERRQYEEGI